ncbi:hypothetical protein EHP00_2010 [Ecytonucleospora hepatopenaei]|uniref:Uncharacterized protein n=1 Tax=Ecytonucleospora hepatopenaei TaxID=646526 RepID=A0A1W0E5B4_9MICR|nr:hypothetical protein EHP00_1963 [Ecytonucleospora hepatopenaei]OQS54467.1 hypothetical protein EHP00_2010 [Ecytonucleospora hepatopenaei]
MALAAATIATSSPVLCNKSKSENIESCDCVTLLNGLFLYKIFLLFVITSMIIDLTVPVLCVLS